MKGGLTFRAASSVNSQSMGGIGQSSVSQSRAGVRLPLPESRRRRRPFAHRHSAGLFLICGTGLRQTVQRGIKPDRVRTPPEGASERNLGGVA